MDFVRLYTDASGETHFTDLEASFSLLNYAPPAPPLHVSDFNPASQWGFIRLKPGWSGDWHPVPGRQVQIFVEGEIEAQVSDGEVRRFGPGSVVLVEDTTGKGHKSWVVGEKELTIFVVRLL